MVIANEREYSLFSLSNTQALTVLSHGNGLMLKEYLFPFRAHSFHCIFLTSGSSDSLLHLQVRQSQLLSV